jgi:hypothetical protein
MERIMDRRVRLDFVAPAALAIAIQQAAQAKMCSRNSWLRMAALAELARQSLERERGGDERAA